MSPDLTGLPFDHYQRYGAASALVDALGGEPVASVLEVGSNRQRILKSFMPQARFVFSDLHPQEAVPGGEDVFVQADATALPFADREFDVVVSLDVMEHIPVDLRERATREMARTASRAVIIGCPLDHPWVHDAETRANGVWERYFGSAYPWLDEHKEFGLVDPSVVEGALRDMGLHVVRFGQGEVDVWAGMMSAHFLKEVVPELAPLVAAADRLYNESVFAGDRSEQAYREFFVAVRDEAEFRRLAASSFLTAPTDHVAKKLMARLPESMEPVVTRVRHAEHEWAATAEVVRGVEAAVAAEAAERQRYATDVDRLRNERDVLLLERDALLLEQDKREAERAELAASRDALIGEQAGMTASRDALMQDRTELAASRDRLEQERDQLAAWRAEAEAALARSEEAVARADARATELALATGRVVSLADCVRERNDELKQDLEQALSRSAQMATRLVAVERRQRLAWAMVGLVVVVAIVVAAASYLIRG